MLRMLQRMGGTGGGWARGELAYLADKHVLLVEVPAEHLGGLTWDWLDFYADFLTFARHLEGLVVVLYGRDDAQVDELQEGKYPVEIESQSRK